MSEPTTIKLRTPIVFGSNTIEELTLRRPKAKDFRSLPMEPRFGDILDLAGRLCAQPKAVMDELDVEDLDEVMNIVGDFVPGGRGTGPTP